MAKVIIGIHGLANKPKKATLAKWWEEAIREGLRVNRGRSDATFEFEMVYWANLLYKTLSTMMRISTSMSCTFGKGIIGHP